MKEELKQAIIAISTPEELREAFALMNRKRDEIVARVALNFTKGDKVSFRKKNTDLVVVGEVIRTNTTSITVDCGPVNGTWRVSPAMLQKVA